MSYCHSAPSVVRPSVRRPSVVRRPSGVNFHIFDFSSETTEQNSTKLDKKQDLNTLYQVCVFRADRKNKMAALASDWLRHFRLLLWNRWTKFNKTWQEARSQLPIPSLCFSGRSEKQDGRPCLWLAETFSTSSLKPLNGIQQNLTGSKISTSSTKFVFFGPIGKTRWPPWTLIGWDIFDFSSEIAEGNSTKLNRKQDLNILYQVCVFRGDWKNKMAALASDWPTHFRLLLWNRWTEFNETWQDARSQRPLPSLCFSGRSEKKDGRPGLWLAETFSTSPLKSLKGIQRNLIGSKISTSSTKFVFFGPFEKNKMAALTSDWLRHFWLLLWNRWTEFNEIWQEARSQRPLPSLCLIGLIGKTRWRPWSLIVWDIFDFFSETAEQNSMKVTGSKISTSSTKFVFFGPIGKTRWPPWPLIDWDIFDFFSETAEWNSTKTWHEVRSQRPLLSLCFEGRSEKQDGHPGFWFAESFSTWLHIVLRCTICGPLGLFFITLLKRFENENISLIIPSKRVEIQMQVILQSKNNISSNLANHWVYKRYFSFSTFDGASPRSKVKRSFLTRSLYSGERQWPFGPLVSSPVPKARVSYCHSAPSVVRPSVRKLFTFSTSSPEPLDGFWWNLVGMKYSWSLTSVVVFRPDPPRGGSRVRPK